MDVDWGAYDRCPVCFRAWDCRRVLKLGRSSRVLTMYWGRPNIVTMGIINNWAATSLRRPHRGRRRRAR